MGSLIEPGRKAPAFTLTDQSGTEHRLSDYQGQTVVLYFYPKDNTPGCTIEACEFRDNLPEFEKIGVTVFGVSPDDVKSHRKFADKKGLNFILLSDPKNENGTAPVCDKYGVWREKKLYGLNYKGAARTTYIIDPDGKVAHRFDKVKVKGHAEETLRWIREHLT